MSHYTLQLFQNQAGLAKKTNTILELPNTDSEILFQENPSQRSRNPNMIPYSFTESIQSYMKGARQESWVLENNHRTPNQEIILRFNVPLPLATIKQNWRRIQRKLREKNFIYAACIELNTGADGQPVNSIHYHFLLDTDLSQRELKETLKSICCRCKLGEYKTDYKLTFPNAGITHWGQRKINYFTKLGYPDKLHLFKKGLRLKKFYYCSTWFVDADGKPTKKSTILSQLKKKYKKRITKNNGTQNSFVLFSH